MNDANRNKKQSRWQELAEDLGIAESTPVSTPPAIAERKAAPAPRIEAEEEPEAEEQQSRKPIESIVIVKTVVEETTFVFESSEPVTEDSEPLETSPIQGESTPDQIFEDGAAEGPADEGEKGSSRSSSRRRRRRRSSKKKKEITGEGVGEELLAQTAEDSPESDTAEECEVEVAAVASAPPPAKPEGEEPPSRSRQRSRGGRRRREPELEPEVVQAATHDDDDDVHESGGNVGLDEDHEDEEIVNYSNWTVPAWKDLIASLYRPER
ncbi:hypothetical protein BH10PLA2_BH10PLA2_34960 [soil metagenome]